MFQILFLKLIFGALYVQDINPVMSFANILLQFVPVLTLFIRVLDFEALKSVSLFLSFSLMAFRLFCFLAFVIYILFGNTFLSSL